MWYILMRKTINKEYSSIPAQLLESYGNGKMSGFVSFTVQSSERAETFYSPSWIFVI